MNLTTMQAEARDQLVRLLRMDSGLAETKILALEDAEVAQIAAETPQHATDHGRARDAIKQLVARFDERRGADQGDAGIPIAAAIAARNGARELLQVHLGLSADDAAQREAALSSEQRIELGRLAEQSHVAQANFRDCPVKTVHVQAIVGSQGVNS